MVGDGANEPRASGESSAAMMTFSTALRRSLALMGVFVSRALANAALIVPRAAAWARELMPPDSCSYLWAAEVAVPTAANVSAFLFRPPGSVALPFNTVRYELFT